MIEFKIDDSHLINRITGRLLHESSGRTYHEVFNPPKAHMKDDVCISHAFAESNCDNHDHIGCFLQITGEPLIRRADDNVESLKTRLSAYHKQTAPLADFYREKQILTTVDATQKTGHVYTAIREAFGSAKSKDYVKFV